MRKLVIAIIIAFALVVTINNLPAQEVSEDATVFSVVGEWNSFVLTWDDEIEEAGSLEFRDNGECVIYNQGVRHFDWYLNDNYLFLAGLGYVLEWEDENNCKLIPAYGDGEMKELQLRRRL